MTTSKGTCSIDGCDGAVRSRGWCGKHYTRFRRWGSPHALRREPPNESPPEECTVDGCHRPHVARGLCRMHYTRMDRGKPIGDHVALRSPDAICSVSECQRRAKAWGYCTMHAQRFYKFGDPEALSYGAPPDDTPTDLYRLWDERGELLYVGVSIDVARRFHQHAAASPWWCRVTWCGVERFPTRPDALNAEWAAVASERPTHNVKLQAA